MEKAEIIPKQQITFLGVITDSLLMTITKPGEGASRPAVNFRCLIPRTKNAEALRLNDFS